MVKGSRFESGTAPATVTRDDPEHYHWRKRLAADSGKGSGEDDLGVRRPDHAQETLSFLAARACRGGGP